MTKKLTILITISVTIMNVIGWRPALAASPPVLITEVQTGFIDASGVESPRQELIELTNVSTNAVNLTGWKIEYLSASNDGSTAPTLIIDTLNGQISANGHGIWEHDGYFPVAPDSIFGSGDTSSTGLLAKSGGHVRLMNGTTMVDCVSWGSAVTITGCDKVSAVAPAGYTLQRRLTNGTYDKSIGVANLTPATPQGGNIYSLSATPPVAPLPTQPQTTPAPDCDNVQLSEILANPSGDDAQGEFIELYNPTDHNQTLYGCSLLLSNGKQYAFTSLDVMNAHEYKAFPYSATGLQLSNSGATVTLVTVVQQTATTYPAAADEQAWALIQGVWYSTNQPTPNGPNSLAVVADSAATTTAPNLLSQLEPCSAGKYRNPDTGRCRNIVETASSSAACPAGQERNVVTGRCRKIVATTTQVPCAADQKRNPDTGRCRKIEAGTAAQKPCEAGQKRNSDTGRCRKTVANSGGKVLGATTSKKKGHLILVGLVLLGVLFYAVYEYRHEARNVLRRFKKHPPMP